MLTLISIRDTMILETRAVAHGGITMKANTRKFYKKAANKATRKTTFVSGGSFKKVYETYNIKRT